MSYYSLPSQCNNKSDLSLPFCLSNWEFSLLQSWLPCICLLVSFYTQCIFLHRQTFSRKVSLPVLTSWPWQPEPWCREYLPLYIHWVHFHYMPLHSSNTCFLTWLSCLHSLSFPTWLSCLHSLSFPTWLSLYIHIFPWRFSYISCSLTPRQICSR